VLLFGWVEDLAAGRSLRLWPVRRRQQAGRRLYVGLGHLPAATAALTGFVAVVIGAGSIIQEPAMAVQPGQNTAPASGVGLHLRTERAEITEDAPEREPPPRVITPVTAEELQAELDAWYQVWPIAGAAVSLYRNQGDAWSGATGFYEDGSVFLPDEQYWIGSVTKTFTTAVVMRLTEWGLIDLEEPVSNFTPDFPEAEHFTVRQLIQHTSGLVVGDETPYDALVTAAAAGLQFEPGTDFEYSRVGYYLLGLVIEDRLGKSYVQVLRDELLDPLQLSNTQMDSEIEPLKYSTHPYAELAAGYGGVTWSSGGLHRELNSDIDYRGTHWSSAGLYSTTQDLARWAAALWGSDFVLSPDSRDRMTTFLDENFDFTGLGTYAICPCWLDGDRLRAERWGHLGATGAIEYDPIDGVALAVHVSGSITDASVLESIDDLSARLRGILRGRPLAVDAALSTRIELPDISDPRLGLTCKEVAVLNDVDEQLRAWFDDACIGRPLAGIMARRSCEEIAGTTYRSEQERLYYLRACYLPEPLLDSAPADGEQGSETEPSTEGGLDLDDTAPASAGSDESQVTPTVPPTPLP
jgi:CubicO group peptidase (beta-lactamase class C family)